jgi:D-methionine transport system substrate-binding protein
MKRVFKFFVLFSLVLLAGAPLFARGKGDGGKAVLRVGASPVPHAELLAQVKAELAAEGIDLQIVEFTDYVTPNLSLDAGELDANYFQHIPYLQDFSAERKLNLASAFGVHVEPFGLYSSKYKAIGDLPDGATIAIPNDATNEGRALLLLQSKGLLTLSPQAGITATVRDITSNPKNFKFRELEAAMLPRTLVDVDAAAINGNYALEAGLNPVKDALIIEGGDSPYVNVVAVKKGAEQDPRILALKKALQSKKIKDFIASKYGGSVVAAF